MPVLLTGKLRFRQLTLGHCAPSTKSRRAQECAARLGGGEDKPSRVPSTLQFVVPSSCFVQPSQRSYEKRTTIVPTLQVGLMPGEVRTRSRAQGEIRGKGRASAQGF